MQHRLFEEVLAMQKLVTCKVDKAEARAGAVELVPVRSAQIPLLNAAAEKMRGLIDFREQVLPR